MLRRLNQRVRRDDEWDTPHQPGDLGVVFSTPSSLGARHNLTNMLWPLTLVSAAFFCRPIIRYVRKSPAWAHRHSGAASKRAKFGDRMRKKVWNMETSSRLLNTVHPLNVMTIRTRLRDRISFFWAAMLFDLHAYDRARGDHDSFFAGHPRL